MARHGSIVVTVDERQARLFRAARTARGAWRLVEEDRLENAWESGHERGRPTMFGRGRGLAPPHTIDPGHTEDEERRRFAETAARWIEGRPAPEGRVVVFAASGFFAPLRDHLSAEGRSRIAVHELELTRLNAHELAEHAAVDGALSRGMAGMGAGRPE